MQLRKENILEDGTVSPLKQEDQKASRYKMEEYEEARETSNIAVIRWQQTVILYLKVTFFPEATRSQKQKCFSEVAMKTDIFGHFITLVWAKP